MYTYKYPRPAVSVDIAIFMPTAGETQILLVERAEEPFRGCFALPGGFVEIAESLEQAAGRELSEETGLTDLPLTQIHTFSQPDRDPRGRVITTCFAGKIDRSTSNSARPGSDASRLSWFPINQLPDLAFDHQQIIAWVVGVYL